MRRDLKVYIAAVAISTALHAPVLFPEATRDAVSGIRKAGTVLVEQYEAYRLRRDRANLVEEARVQLKEGKLKMGEFILKANELDAREKGETADNQEAMKRYEKYREEFGSLVSSGKDPKRAIADVLKDMDYHGVPGGTMINALLEGGGSCAQFAPLISSLLYDSGYKENAYMRRYAQNSDGVSHITAVFVDGNKEYDMQAGRRAKTTGVRFHASEMVEAYAREHGLAPKLPIKAGGWKALAKENRVAGTPEGRPTGFEYPSPPAGQSYSEGVPPLFLGKGIGRRNPMAASAGSKATINTDEEISWIITWIDGYLNPKNLAKPAGSYTDGLIVLNPIEKPTEAKLQKLSTLIEFARNQVRDGDRTPNPWVKAMAYGTLSGLYREAEWQFSISGKYDLAESVREQRKTIIQEGAKILETLDYKKWDIPADPHQLIYLGGKGQEALFGFVKKYNDARFGAKKSIAMLLAKESSRKEAFEMVRKFSVPSQAAVFEALGDADIEGPGEFFKAYALYRRINKTFPNEQEKSSAAGVLNVGERIPVNQYEYVLEGIESTDDRKAAIIAVKRIGDGKIVKKIAVNVGHTVEFDESSGMAPVRCNKVAPGYTIKAKWADISIMAFVRNFEGLRRIVNEECFKHGMGSEWQVALTAACGMHLYRRPQHPGSMWSLEEFNGWLEPRSKIKGMESLKAFKLDPEAEVVPTEVPAAGSK